MISYSELREEILNRAANEEADDFEEVLYIAIDTTARMVLKWLEDTRADAWAECFLEWMAENQ